MNARPDGQRYHALLISLHWLTLLLLVAVYALIEFRGIFPKGSDGRELMKHWHFMLGLAVLALLFVRLGLRAVFPTPPIVPPPPAWQQAVAKLVLLLLYVFLFAMPMLGWATLSAKGKAIPFFGLELPPLLDVDKPRARRLEDIHATIGRIGYALIALHAAAAVFHHHVMRDNALARMLPARTDKRAA